MTMKFDRVISEVSSKPKKVTFPDGSYKFFWDDHEYQYYDKDCELHREDGPAWEDRNTIKYCFHGKLHRTDGPAVIYKHGYYGVKHRYYVNDTEFNEEEFNKHFGDE